jgi:YD repeat-containing protein
VTLARTWNSKWPTTQTGFASGLFGLNWRSTYEERVFMGSDGSMKYLRGDGSFWSFGYDGTSGKWLILAPANGGATLASGGSYWTLTFNNGEQRLFANSSGSLTSIIDRNGNTTQLSYDGLNRLVTVTDPASRHLNLTYSNANYPYQATGVASDVGISLSYSYDQQGRLTTVTKPDNTTITFEYNAQSLITAVKDSTGKVLESHTYDSVGRGLTSSRAGGVEAVTVAYPQ